MNSEEKIKKYVLLYPNCHGVKEHFFNKKKDYIYISDSLGISESFCFESIEDVKNIILKSIQMKEDLINLINNEFQLIKNSIIESDYIEEIDYFLKSRREYIEILLKRLQNVI